MMLMLILLMTSCRWWEKKEANLCTDSKSSRMGPEQLSGSFLLLAAGIALTVGACVVQILVVFVKGHKSWSK